MIACCGKNFKSDPSYEFLHNKLKQTLKLHIDRKFYKSLGCSLQEAIELDELLASNFVSVQSEFISYSGDSSDTPYYSSTYYVTHVVPMVEWKSPLTRDDAFKRALLENVHASIPYLLSANQDKITDILMVVNRSFRKRLIVCCRLHMIVNSLFLPVNSSKIMQELSLLLYQVQHEILRRTELKVEQALKLEFQRRLN